jgi:phage replication O-like protein O
LENPYASISRVNPPANPEHDYRKVANEIWWALLKVPISGAEVRVALTVYDRTIGYGQKSRGISLSTIQKFTSLRRDSVVSAVKQLEDSHIILVSHGTGGAVSEYMFNLHYDTWQLDKQGTLDLGSTEMGTTSTLDGSTEMGTTPGSTKNRTSPSSPHVTPTAKANSRGSTRTRTSPRDEPGAERVKLTNRKLSFKTNLLSREKAEECFARFWKEYPKKLAKVAAEKAFRKLKPDEGLLTKILEAIEVAKRSDQWTRDEGQYVPFAATWLNQRRWEDEYTEGKHGSKRVSAARGLVAHRRDTTDEERLAGAAGAAVPDLSDMPEV